MCVVNVFVYCTYNFNVNLSPSKTDMPHKSQMKFPGFVTFALYKNLQFETEMNRGIFCIELPVLSSCRAP